jgi:hypothetical protein
LFEAGGRRIIPRQPTEETEQEDEAQRFGKSQRDEHTQVRTIRLAGSGAGRLHQSDHYHDPVAAPADGNASSTYAHGSPANTHANRSRLLAHWRLANLDA